MMKEKYIVPEVEFIEIELDILTMNSCPSDTNCPGEMGCNVDNTCFGD